MTRVVRLGLAGLGAVAQAVYIPLLQRRPDLFAPTALCDLSPMLVNVIGERVGVPPRRRYTDMGEMLDGGGFDAVVVLTSGSHAEPVRQALLAGYPVLCEKPLAYTRADADELVARTEATAVPQLMLGYMKLCDPATRRLTELLGQLGGPGAIRSIEISVLHPSTSSQLEFASIQPAAGDVPAGVLDALTAAEEQLLDAAVGETAPLVRSLYRISVLSMCHNISLIRWLAGSPVSVDHVAVWPEAVPRAGEPSIEVTGPLPVAGRYSIRWHYLEDYPAYRETLSVHHAAGSLEITFPSPYLLNAPATLVVVERDGEAERRSELRSVTEAFEEQLVAFHAMVTAGKPPPNGASGGREDIVTAQRIARRFAELTGRSIGGEAATA